MSSLLLSLRNQAAIAVTLVILSPLACAGQSASPPHTWSDTAIREALGKSCGKLQFTEQTLEEVVEKIRTETGLTILFDKRTLEEEGVVIDGPTVTISLQNVTWHDVLDHVLREQDLSYTIVNHAVMLTTFEVCHRLEEMPLSIVGTSQVGLPADEIAKAVREIIDPEIVEQVSITPVGTNAIALRVPEVLRVKIVRWIDQLEAAVSPYGGSGPATTTR